MKVTERINLFERYFFIMDNSFLLSLVFISIAIAIFSIVRQISKTVQLVQGLGHLSDAQEVVAGKRYQAEYEGLQYEYQYFSARKRTPPSLKIYVPCPLPGYFLVGEESGSDRFFRNVGISSEIQTGDVDFDGNYYIQADHVEFARQYFSYLEKREAIKQLFQLGFHELKYDGKSLVITISPFHFSQDFSQVFLPQTLRQLRVLTENVPRDYPMSTVSGVPVWKITRTIFYTLSIVLFIFGIAGSIYGWVIYHPLDEGDVFIFSLRYSLPALLFFIIIAVTFLRERASSHKELINILFISLFGFVTSGFGATILSNGYFDKAPMISHDCLIVRKWISHSNYSKTYHLDLMSWRSVKHTEIISVSRSTYYPVVAGNTVMNIQTKSGHWGFE